MCTDTSSKMWWPKDRNDGPQRRTATTDRIDEQKRGDGYGILRDATPVGQHPAAFKLQFDIMMLDTLWKPYKLTTVPNGSRVIA